MSEDALEASHKIFRFSRLNHTRKHNRVSTNTDVLNYLILLSDPLLSSKASWKRRSKNHENKDFEHLILLSETDMEISVEEEDEEEEEVDLWDCQ